MTHLIFGVDGLNHDFVQKQIDEGRMAQFERLQNQQQTDYGEFESYICDGYDTPHTGPNWTSLYTGLKPEDHGITSGGWNDGDSKFHTLNTIWDAIGDSGKTMYLNGMPMTYKAKEINGKMISGFVSPTIKSMWHKCIYPEEFFESNLPSQYIENTSSYVAKVKTDGAKPSTDTESFYDEIVRSEGSRVSNFLSTAESEDIFAFGTTLVDKIGHVAGIEEGERYAERAYAKLDRMLAALVAYTQPEKVTVISDHGFSGFTHDLHGYYLDTTGRGMDDIFDFTPYMMDIHGVEVEDKFFGPNENDTPRITQEEEDEIKQQLENMGYF
jgi:predicted AlkP superfamily phosphohydrolase/phosphomutase